MYSNWLYLRDSFKFLEEPEAIRKYVEGNMMYPCVFRGSLESPFHLNGAILYSIVGETGYTLWGDNRGSIRLKEEPVGYPFPALFRRYFESYLAVSDSKVEMRPQPNKVLIGFLYAPGVKYVGAGVVTDLDIDATRNFKFWKEDQRYWILRFRLKVIWLSNSLRKRIEERKEEILKWAKEGGDPPNVLEGVQGEDIPGVDPQQANNCYENQEYLEGAKTFLQKKFDGEVKETLEFYEQINMWHGSQGKISLRRATCRPLDEALKLAEGRIKEEVYLPEPKTLNLILSSLRTGNILLVGPPGVGKTEIATILADSLCDDNEKATANALWTRRDLIGGESIRNGNVVWKMGILMRAYLKTSDSLFPVVLEEINRADIDKAFGEFFTMFSSADPMKWRVPQSLIEEIRSYSSVQGELKELLNALERDSQERRLSRMRIIATMNLKDVRNLYQIGDALTRRFSTFFLDCPKGDGDVDFLVQRMKMNGTQLPDGTIKVLKETVSSIRERLGKRFCLSTATVSKVLNQLALGTAKEGDIDELIKIYLGTVDRTVHKKISELSRRGKSPGVRS
ncbi:AAA domain-containing protein [Metallosphaera tengchongensis]|uniref:AAA domain-containing protein n=1 Tax=Metallosphaera tengchongensis TaxID=1532350 RepID=A0A6N0NWV1_9CREN|nr:AAA family ATPase [Metallosphaera tengchongensis]QKR00675.1 AAA domain-containing protein [Metallosphaera tengchongensis]